MWLILAFFKAGKTEYFNEKKNLKKKIKSASCYLQDMNICEFITG